MNRVISGSRCSGKSTLACLSILYDMYVETTVNKYSKYKKLPRKLKKRLSSNIKERIKELK